MEAVTTEESSQNSSVISSANALDENHEVPVSAGVSNHGFTESEPQHEIAGGEIRSTLEVIASTGKFWHCWDKLKNTLSIHLKQVLLEYPEAKLAEEEQRSSLGETFQDLVKRLDDALNNFIEGAPFTLQRLCEILLDAQSIYPRLSKLALALEKNLLVTSTLTVCNDPYPLSSVENSTCAGETKDSLPHSDAVQNGTPSVEGDGDEIMAEVEELETDNDATIDMESIEEIARPSEAVTMPTGNS